MTKKLTDLKEITSPASDDVIYVVDVSDKSEDTAGSSRRVAVGNIGGGGSTASVVLAQYTSTDATTNINAGTGVVAIAWDKALISNAAVTQPTNQEIKVDGAGIWLFYVSLAFDSGSARINPRIRFRINGTIQSEEGGSGYIRAASGHGEASNSLQMAYNLNDGDVVEVVTDQLGNSGTVTLRSDASVLSVNKLAGVQKTDCPLDMGTLVLNGTGDFSVSGIGFAPSRIKFENALGVEATDQEGGPANTGNSEENFGGFMVGFAKNDNGTTKQQVMSSGVSGNSVNSIRVFSSSAKCIGVSYGAKNGTTEVGEIQASLKSWDSDGFTVNVDTYSSMADLSGVLVMYTAWP